MSIVRVGLAETKNFSEGYDAIFGRKKGDKGKKAEAAPATNIARKKKRARKK